MVNTIGLTTAEAVRVVSEQMHLPLSEREVNNWMRSWPITEVPPLVRNRRRWGPAHVARLRSEVESRRAG